MAEGDQQDPTHLMDPQTPGDLAQLQAQYGVTGAGSSGSSPLSRISDGTAPIYLGTHTPSVGRAVGDLNYTGSADDTKPINDALLDFYGWDVHRLIDFQTRAAHAGLLKTVSGDWDTDTAGVWEMMVKRSAAFYAKDRKLTPDDILDMIVHSKGTDAGDGHQIQLTSGASLEQTVQSTARQLLGRKLSAKDVARFTTLIQGMQRGQQGAVADAGTGGVTVEGVDPGAEAEAFLNTHFAGDVAHHDTLQGAEMLRDALLGGTQ